MADLLSAADLLGTADVLDAGDDSAANSRSRWRVSVRETNVLEAVFASSPRPNKNTIHQLATMLGVKPRQVQVWFQNRRQRWRKDFLELERARTVHLGELTGKVIDFHGDLPIPGPDGEISMPAGWERLLLAPGAAAPADLAAAVAACAAAVAACAAAASATVLSGAPALALVSATPTTSSASHTLSGVAVKAEEIDTLNEIDLSDLLNFGAVSSTDSISSTSPGRTLLERSGSDTVSTALSDSTVISLNGSPGPKSPSRDEEDGGDDTIWLGMEWLIEDEPEMVLGVSATLLC